MAEVLKFQKKFSMKVITLNPYKNIYASFYFIIIDLVIIKITKTIYFNNIMHTLYEKTLFGYGFPWNCINPNYSNII